MKTWMHSDTTQIQTKNQHFNQHDKPMSVLNVPKLIADEAVGRIEVVIEVELGIDDWLTVVALTAAETLLHTFARLRFRAQRVLPSFAAFE